MRIFSIISLTFAIPYFIFIKIGLLFVRHKSIPYVIEYSWSLLKIEQKTDWLTKGKINEWIDDINVKQIQWP